MTALDIARAYTRRGWRVIPVPAGTKAPLINAWQNLRLEEGDLPTRFNGRPMNVGVLLGSPSGWLVDVDLDHPLAVKLADLFLPKTGAVFGRAGNPRSHRIYRASAEIRTKKYERRDPSTDKEQTIVELRSSGTQTIFPGSTHVSGEAIEWDADGEPAIVDPAVLESAVRDLAETVFAELGDRKQEKTRRDYAPDDSAPDRERVLSALGSLNPSRADSRSDWICVGMALHSFDAGLLDDWDRWSQQSSKYREGEPARKWDSFNSDGITVLSLLQMAHKDGWRAPRVRKRSTRTSRNATDGATPALAAITNGQPSKEGFTPAPMSEIVGKITAGTGGWPQRVGSMLFTHERDNSIDWLDSPPALFGYIGAKTGQPATFHNVTGAHTKPEVFAELRRTAKSHESVENLPHEPRIDGSYYACEFPPTGNGDALRALVNRFCPATPIDGDLILALLVTPFWGGRGGARPMFALTSDFGRGTGKTTAVAVCGRLAGGVVELSMAEDVEITKQRLLSPDGITKRVTCVDNAKGSRLSSADLEALVTCPAISGKRLYVGEASRPNTLVWTMTLNGVSLATDLAQRSVIIKLAKPEHCGDWAERTYQFVDDNRQALIGDILGFLRSDRSELAAYSRWGAWERDVLARLPEPSEAQRVILERQGSSDAEREEVDVVEDYIESQLSGLQYPTETARIFIPSTVARDWFNQATNERHSTIGASRWLNQQIDEGKFRRLAGNRCRTYGRGFLWIGEHADDAAVATDLESRLSTRERRL